MQGVRTCQRGISLQIEAQLLEAYDMDIAIG